MSFAITLRWQPGMLRNYFISPIDQDMLQLDVFSYRCPSSDRFVFATLNLTEE